MVEKLKICSALGHPHTAQTTLKNTPGPLSAAADGAVCQRFFGSGGSGSTLGDLQRQGLLSSTTESMNGGMDERKKKRPGKLDLNV